MSLPSLMRRADRAKSVGSPLPRRMLVGALCAFLPAVSFAQMGGGGMGGGGMRGGGMGRGGMGGGMPRAQSPADRAKENLKQSDPLALLLDHKKVLQLTKAQQDTFKNYRDEMKELQQPLFKDLEKVFADGAGRGGGGGAGGRMGRGGMGGGMPPGGAAPRGDGDAEGGGRGRGGMLPDTASKLLDRLTDLQDAYRERARAHLDSTQRVRVDSLQNAMLEAERLKAEKALEELRKRAGRG